MLLDRRPRTCGHQVSTQEISIEGKGINIAHTLPDDESQAAMQEMVQLVEGIITGTTAW